MSRVFWVGLWFSKAHRSRICSRICKRCSFECDMGKYSTRSMHKVWAFRRTPCSLNMCCIFTYRTKNVQRLYFLTRSPHTWHILPYIVLNLQLECDMGWYRYTSHSENHSTECEKKYYLLEALYRRCISIILMHLNNLISCSVPNENTRPIWKPHLH